ncbi:MAG TPA: FHA domain-containing protein [Polyangia bacterium]|nr:FHA domain-containing protein [Polyangia bacterium]
MVRRQGVSARASRAAPGLAGVHVNGSVVLDEKRPASSAAAVDQPCPNCGQPMLAAWGSTCGSCRPGISLPKTLCLSAVSERGRSPSPGLGLGWFVVVQSPDQQRIGSLIALAATTSVLSRGVRQPAADEEWFDFSDEFMSCGHAMVCRPTTSDRNEAFAIRDRVDPGPSANGTFVDSHKLGRGEVVKLSEGDIVRVGTTEMVFKSLWLPPAGQGMP